MASRRRSVRPAQLGAVQLGVHPASGQQFGVLLVRARGLEALHIERAVRFQFALPHLANILKALAVDRIPASTTPGKP